MSTGISGATGLNGRTFEAAVSYCEGGYPITLADADYSPSGGKKDDYGKKPIGKGWQNRRWTAEAIEATFARYRNVNVGIRVGPDAGFIDIETDGPEAEQEFAKLFEGCEAPVTPTFKSRRGKHHLYRWDERLAVVNQGFFKIGMLDVLLGAGGIASQCIVPPSRNGDLKTYREWLPGLSLDECEPAQLPDEVIKRLVALGTRKRSSPQNGKPPAAVAEGCRNSTATQVVGRLARCAARLDESTTEAVWNQAAEWNAKNCTPPLSEQELRGVFDSIIGRELERRGKIAPPTANAGDAANALTLAEPIGQTDHANAERFVAQYGANVRYVSTWNKWFVWDSTRWAEDTTLQVQAMVKATMRGQWDDLVNIRLDLDDQGFKRAANFVRKSEDANGIDAALRLARSEPGIAVSHDVLDADPMLLNCANGTLDLRTGTLRPHSRDDMLTKLCPTAFEPSSLSLGDQCPQWIAFLHETTCGDADLMDFLQDALGYTLTGEVREHVLFFCSGDGANGKSVLLGVAQFVLGADYSMTAPPNMLLKTRGDRHPTDVAGLKGKRLVITSEPDAAMKLDEALVKSLTGGDVITARRMREDFWEFTPSHTLWMAANHKPPVRGTDYGIWRRMRVIPFENKVEEGDQDKGLPDKLRCEASGILNWMVAGLAKYRRRGLTVPDTVKFATDSYRVEMDSVGRFVEECCEADEHHRTPAGDLYKAYSTWAHGNGEYPLKQTNFGAELTKRGYDRHRSNGTHYRLGVRLIHPAAESVPGSAPF